MLNVRVGCLGELQPIVARIVLPLQRVYELALEGFRVVVVGFAGGLAAPLACLWIFVLEVPMAAALVNAVAVFGFSFSTRLSLDHPVYSFHFVFFVPFPAPFGRPPNLPHALSCSLECFFARVLPPFDPFW